MGIDLAKHPHLARLMPAESSQDVARDKVAEAKVGANTGKPAKFNRFAKHARRKPGERNKLESAYEAYLQLLLNAGEIDGFYFEGIKLRLADNTHFTPDFLVFASDGVVELHDTKGTTSKLRASGIKERTAWIEDDAKLKLKIVAERFPFRVFAVFKTPEGWQRMQF